MDATKRQNALLLTASFARTLAQLAASIEDPAICDEAALLELLALADRAEEALNAAA